MSEDLGIEGALRQLVKQFKDPFAFLRELIQNSIDAGSDEIDVYMEYEPRDDLGVMTIHIDDFGEGMDRKIIDSKLTRLFNSSKDGDMTKIGKFGIGFVSVFAIEPDAVVIDTSRAGENWRIIFNKDRSFTLLKRQDPGEGTQIKVIKRVSQRVYKNHRTKVLQSIKLWCKHVEAEIRFEDEPVNESFTLNLPITAEHKEKGTTIVAGYTASSADFSGFYNKGLTLLEEDDKSLHPGVSYKVSSRYLEYTLTRDRIIENANYKKALKLLDSLIKGPLIDTLFRKIEGLILSQEPQAEAHPSNSSSLASLQNLLLTRLRGGELISKENAKRPILRSISGRPISTAALTIAARANKIFLAEHPSTLTEALENTQHLILPSSGEEYSLSLFFTPDYPPQANALYCLPKPPTQAQRTAWTPLGKALSQLATDQGMRFAGLEPALLSYPGSGLQGWVAITQKKFGEITPKVEALELGNSIFSRKRTLVVNLGHPTVRTLLKVANKEPEFAAYTLFKLFFLNLELDPILESSLASCAVNQRKKRLKLTKESA